MTAPISLAMTNDDRLNRMGNQLIDMRLAVSALLETVTLHQRNFDTLVNEIRNIRSDMRDIQADVRGLQTENRRILDILQHREEDDGTTT